MLAVAPYETLLPLQANLEQSEVVVPLLLQPLQPLQLLAGLDGHLAPPLLCGAASSDEAPPVPARAALSLSPGLLPQVGPVTLQLEHQPGLAHSQTAPGFGRDNPAVEVELSP